MSLKKYLSEAELASQQPVAGDNFDISIRDITNIETTVLEHTDGSVLIELDETAIKMLEECGVSLEEDEQLDEIWPALARMAAPVAGAVAKGAGKAGNAIVKSAGAAALKNVGKKIDKKLFGPAQDDYDFEENMNSMRKLAGLKEADIDADVETDDETEYMPKVGDVVRIDYPTGHQGHVGEVVEVAPSGDFAYVQFKDDDIESYHSSDLIKVSDEEADDYYYGSEDYNEDINAIRKLSGMEPKETVKEENYDKSHGSPYDRGAADSYYGRKPRPHKIAPYTGPDAVKGQMQLVTLTDPAEIAAYNAGYSENDDFKDYGESVMPEGIEDMDMRISSIPRTEPFKLKNIVVKSPGGKTYTFDTEEDARRLFLDKWNVIKDPKSGWKVDMNNTKPTDESIEVNEAEYQGHKVQLGKPMQGDVKKFKVYVKDPKTGNVKKVNFGDPNMRIKKSNPARRKSFRARHNCDNPGPRTKARYWSCRKW